MFYSGNDKPYEGIAMTLIVELHDNKEAALKAKAQAQGVSAEEFAARILDREIDAPQASMATAGKSLAEKVREIWRNVPHEAWDAMPTDGASEHDHYIYGLPKRNV